MCGMEIAIYNFKDNGRNPLIQNQRSTKADNHPERETNMTQEFQVQKAGLAGQNWTTVCRGPEDKAREAFQRTLKLYSVGRFRLVDGNGVILEERKASLFSDN
jgi:hypothetical protein